MARQYHLLGRGFSGRAVRVQPLDPIESENNLLAAAKLAGPEAQPLEFKKIEWRNGVKLFITEYSEACTDPTKPEVKWKKVKAGDLDDVGTVFTSKDIQALEAIFRDYHEVMPSEIDAIMGKAIDLTQ